MQRRWGDPCPPRKPALWEVLKAGQVNASFGVSCPAAVGCRDWVRAYQFIITLQLSNPLQRKGSGVREFITPNQLEFYLLNDQNKEEALLQRSVFGTPHQCFWKYELKIRQRKPNGRVCKKGKFMANPNVLNQNLWL